jgi:hypothetical protein
MAVVIAVYQQHRRAPRLDRGHRRRFESQVRRIVVRSAFQSCTPALNRSDAPRRIGIGTAEKLQISTAHEDHGLAVCREMQLPDILAIVFGPVDPDHERRSSGHVYFTWLEPSGVQYWGGPPRAGNLSSVSDVQEF